MKPITVLIADDHYLVRYGIKSVLEKAEGINVIGEAGSGQEAIELYEELNPDVSVIDITMPNLNGIETTRSIIKKDPDAKILILSMHVNEEYLNHVLNAGARGYLFKNCGTVELTDGVRAVAAGEKIFSKRISELMAQRYVKQQSDNGETTTLTPREKEILELISQGNTSQKIADLLIISPRTVETHRTNLMRKLDIKNTAGLVRYAIENGYLPDL
ncbi:MAG: response regulator transcription factor [Balneolales bacterium]